MVSIPKTTDKNKNKNNWQKQKQKQEQEQKQEQKQLTKAKTRTRTRTKTTDKNKNKNNWQKQKQQQKLHFSFEMLLRFHTVVYRTQYSQSHLCLSLCFPGPCATQWEDNQVALRKLQSVQCGLWRRWNECTLSAEWAGEIWSLQYWWVHWPKPVHSPEFETNLSMKWRFVRRVYSSGDSSRNTNFIWNCYHSMDSIAVCNTCTCAWDVHLIFLKIAANQFLYNI